MSGQLEMAELHSDRSEKVMGRVQGYLENFDAIKALVLVGSEKSKRDYAFGESLSFIDLKALEDGDVNVFISTLERARQELLDMLELSKRKTGKQLNLVQQRLSELDSLLEKAERHRIDVSYPKVSQS